MDLEEKLRGARVFSDVSDDHAAAFAQRAWEQLKESRTNGRRGRLLKRRFVGFTAAVAAVAFVFVGFHVYWIGHRGQSNVVMGHNPDIPVRIGNASIDPTAPGTFSRATLLQIRSDLSNAVTQPHNYEVYALTGGLGRADPRIGMWDATGFMTFAASGTVYWLQEYSQNPAFWRISQNAKNSFTITMSKTASATGKPIPWIRMRTKSGQTYYKWDGTTTRFYFKKGNTYIYLTIARGTPATRHVFPEGIINHLVPVGNPVKHQ